MPDIVWILTEFSRQGEVNHIISTVQTRDKGHEEMKLLSLRGGP